MPKGERRGGGISKDQWEAFSADYCAVMPGLTGKATEMVKRAAALYVQRLTSVKTNKPVLGRLNEQLAIYTQSAPNAEQFIDVLTFLTEKINTLLNASDEELLNNL
jgi:hypothetical protein